MIIAREYLNKIETAFKFAEKRSFCQIATVAKQIEANATLIDESCADEKDSYHIDEIFPHHGNVILRPYCWDIFSLGLNDFSESSRVQMVLEQDNWKVFEDAPKICPLDLYHG